MSDEQPPRGFGLFRARAEKVVKDPEALKRLMELASAKAQEHSGKLEAVKAGFLDLVRLLKAYARGEYKKVPWATIVTGAIAVLYFVSPLDMVPDFLIGVGLVDDAAVIAFALKALKGDLAEFITWEGQRR